MEAWEAPVPRTIPEYIVLGRKSDFTDDLKRLLASPNICSKRWVFEQYDSMVQTNTVEGPGGEGGVVRVKGTARGLAMALDGNGRWCWLDPKLGAMHAVAESARNVACTGAIPIAATNCLNFGNPEKPQIMWQFSETIDGMRLSCQALETPITGGNVSFYNETLGEGIYPTPVIGVVGILEDVHKTVAPHFRQPGRALVLLRVPEPVEPSDLPTEFGSSEYAKEILGHVWGYPPALDLDKEAALQKAMIEMIDHGLIASAKDCSEGGLAVTLAECCFAYGTGAQVDLTSHRLVPEFVLFGEDASRILISCDPQNVGGIQQVAHKYSLSAEQIGSTISGKLEIAIDGEAAVAAEVSELKQEWAGALAKALHVETEERLVPATLQKS
jgi:phosphoribosylformylglycinamidine synthase